jgi:hypothetical protein
MTIRRQISTTKIKLFKSIHLSTCYKKLIVENEFGLNKDEKMFLILKTVYIIFLKIARAYHIKRSF